MRRSSTSIWFGLLLFTFCLGGQSTRAAERAEGVIVKIGLGDSIDELVQIERGDHSLVCGLDTDQSKVAVARKALQAKGLLGPITATLFDGKRLPFAENMVNQLIADRLGGLPKAEVLRVLVPGGAAIVGSKKTVKPWPEEMDEWTHYLHDASNNAVSKDAIAGHPTSMQWVDGPKYGRMHESLRRITSVVTSGGRLFSILDEGNDQDISMPPVWRLVCRDAFNGVVLWRRDLVNWAAHLRYFRSGPADLAHRLVAVGDKVYVTLGVDQPISMLDAATGKTLITVKGSEHASQFLCDGDEMVIMTDPNIYHGDNKKLFRQRGVGGRALPQKIMLADRKSGAIKWSKDFSKHIFTTVSMSKDNIVYQTIEGVTCLNRRSGEQLWSTPAPFVPKYQESGGHETYTMVVHKDVAIAAGSKKRYGFSLADGKILWESASCSGYNSAPDLFVINDMVSSGAGHFLDYKTGKEVKRNMSRASGRFPTLSHHRCYRKKATENFILSSRSGVELIGVREDNWGEVWLHHWIRGECQYGIMPANGMLYAPTDPCACNLQTKLNGNWALTPRKPAAPWTGQRLFKGPAFGKTTSANAAPWPTYRGNFERSGTTRAAFAPKTVKEGWKLPLGAKLSGITVGVKNIYVAAVDRNQVIAVNRKSGKVAWSFSAGGRVDSPPTLHRGLAIFGCADGFVYAVSEADGRLAWSFMAAPEDRRVVSFGQLESAWPVHGSVLIEKDTLIVSAGRQTYIDGGIHVYKMDPVSGAVKSKSVLCSIDPKTGKQPDPTKGIGGVNLQGTQNDILAAVGGDVYMRHMKVDFAGKDFSGVGEHLFSEVGLLDDTQWYRCYWLFAEKFNSGYGSWNSAGNNLPSGRIMVYDDELLCGYGRRGYPGAKAGQWQAKEKYRLYATRKKDHTKVIPGDPNARKKWQRKTNYKPKYLWEKEVPVMARAMVLAKDKIILAGLPDPKPKRTGRFYASEEVAKTMAAVYAGKKGGMLAIYDIQGNPVAETKLAAEPVFDGMAVANDTIYIALKNGELVELK